MIILRALGNCLIETPKTTLSPSQEILFATALFLILERNRKVTKESIEAVIWPGAQHTAGAHHRLRQTILKLKQAGFPIVREDGFIRIDCPVETDFEVALSAHANGDFSTTPGSLQVLPEYWPSCSDELSRWIDAKRSQITARLIPTLLTQINRSRHRAEWSRVESLARTCLEVDPFNEEAILARAEAVAMRGGKLEALALLDEYLEIVGETEDTVRLQPTVLRRRISERRPGVSYRADTEFVGRASTMEFLGTVLQRMRAGRGEAVLLCGPAGIGKSRVLDEFSRFGELQGARIERISCQSRDIDRPLSVFIDLSPRLLEMRGAIGCSEETISSLKALNSNEQTETGGQADKEQVYPRIRSALFDVLDAVCEEQPVALCLDDVQWMDPISARLIRDLVGWSGSHKLMLLLTIRTGATLSVLDSWPQSTHLELQSFDSQTSRILFDQLTLSIGKQPSDPFKEKSIAVAGGNPFFLHEIARQWAETGDEHNLPQSLEIILRERTSRLSPNGLLTLQVCALLGKYSTLERIENVLELKGHELISSMNELGHASMVLVESESSSAARYSCRHELLAQAALNRLMEPALAYLHRRIAVVLESEGTSESAILWNCANHWHLGGDSKKALTLVSTCSKRLVKLGLYAEAAKICKEALALANSSADKITLLTEMLGALQLAGDWNEVYHTASELSVRNDAVSSNDSGKHNNFELIKFDAQWKSTINWRDLLNDLSPCIYANSASGNHRLSAGILGLKLAGNLGSRQELEDIFMAISTLFERDDVDPLLRLEAEMIYHTDNGNLDMACSAAEQHVAHTTLGGSPLAIVGSMRNAALVFRRAGAFDKVNETVLASYNLATENKLLRHASLIALSFVEIMLDAGNFNAARVWHAKSDESLLSGDLHSKAEHHFHAARLALSEDDLDSVEDLFRDYFETIKKDQSLLRRLSALALLVFLQTARGDLPESFRATLTEMEKAHLEVRGNGGQDFETAALITGLLFVGESDKAATLLSHYRSSWRRDRGPLGPELMRVANQIFGSVEDGLNGGVAPFCQLG